MQLQLPGSAKRIIGSVTVFDDGQNKREALWRESNIQHYLDKITLICMRQNKVCRGKNRNKKIIKILKITGTWK